MWQFATCRNCGAGQSCAETCESSVSLIDLRWPQPQMFVRDRRPLWQRKQMCTGAHLQLNPYKALS